MPLLIINKSYFKHSECGSHVFNFKDGYQLRYPSTYINFIGSDQVFKLWFARDYCFTLIKSKSYDSNQSVQRTAKEMAGIYGFRIKN